MLDSPKPHCLNHCKTQEKNLSPIINSVLWLLRMRMSAESRQELPFWQTEVPLRVSRVRNAVGSKYVLEIRPLASRSEEHTSELQSRQYLVCRLLLEKKI